MDFKILLLEDGESDYEVFQESINVINDSQEKTNYILDVAKTIGEATEKIANHSYQGFVVDINLGEDENGNEFIDSIMNNYRIPVIVYSATPDRDCKVTCFIKSEKTPQDVVIELMEEEKTGVFRILGGTGELEKRITDLFWKTLYPNIDVWKKCIDEDTNTEVILLRYALANLLEQLDNNQLDYITEEMYILYSEGDKKTGMIYKNVKSGIDYILLSPPCDLVIREDGKSKSDCYLLCEIERIDWKTIKSCDRKNIIDNRIDYYHWLPDNKFYDGGIINFRKVTNCSPDELGKTYEFKIKIQDIFVKAILQRFSAYYARQGQPDFDVKKEITRIKELINS